MEFCGMWEFQKNKWDKSAESQTDSSRPGSFSPAFFFILHRGSEHVNEGKEPAEISRRVREALFGEYFFDKTRCIGDENMHLIKARTLKENTKHLQTQTEPKLERKRSCWEVNWELSSTLVGWIRTTEKKNNVFSCFFFFSSEVKNWHVVGTRRYERSQFTLLDHYWSFLVRYKCITSPPSILRSPFCSSLPFRQRSLQQ